MSGTSHILASAQEKAGALQSAQQAGGKRLQPTDPASKARSAVDKSEAVVNKIAAGEPVNKADAAAAERVETDMHGNVPSNSAGSTLQSAADKLQNVAKEKLMTGEALNERDAAQIQSADAKLHGGEAPKGGIGSQARSAAAKARQAGLN